MLIVHHLDFSRATRVVWLLEELGLDYRLIRYSRPVGGPAPDSLKVVHPLGTSPVLADDGFVLAESSAILRYLDARYGGSRFTPQDIQDRATHDAHLDYVEGSLASPLFVPLMSGSELPAALRMRFAAQLDRAWDFVETSLQTKPYLMGNEPTLADMQMSYMLAVASATGGLEKRPKLNAYFGRMMERPGLIRAIAAGGPMA